jgi:hypothetical protein
MSSYVFDSSNLRLNLLHTLFAQQIANQMAGSGGGHMRPMPPLRMPQTSNPFGQLMPTGGLTASATHGAGYTAGGQDGRLAMVGAATPTQGGAINWFGPPPGGATGGPGGPRFSPPAMSPPPGILPLPR